MVTSKCHQAKTEEIYDGAGEYVLTMCLACRQECQTNEVCDDCEGTGKVWEGEHDNIRLVPCITCQGSKAELEADSLIETLRGN